MSTMMSAAARLEHARHFGERARRLRHVVQHQHQRRRVEPRIVDRQRLELAAAQVDVVERRAAACFAACSIAADASTRDHARDERRERRADLAGAAAEIADRPVARRRSAASAAR